MKTKILSILVLISVLISQADDSVFSCERAGNPSVNGHLRVPISINNQPERYMELLRKVSRSTDDIKKTRRAMQIAIQRAGGSLSAACKIYESGMRAEDFYHLVRIYGLSGFTRDTKATVKRLKACVRESGGNMKEGSKLYFNGVENEDRFIRLARKYGQSGYTAEIRQKAEAIREAIRKTGGNISNASTGLYPGDKLNEPRLWHAAKAYGQLGYIRDVIARVKKLRAMIDMAGGNFAKVTDNKPHGKSHTAVFHNLAKYYGQLEYAARIRARVLKMHSAIEIAGGGIEKAAMIYYGETKYNSKKAVQFFTSLIKRYGQEEYIKEVKSRIKGIRAAIEKAGGNLGMAALIYYKIPRKDQADKNKIASAKSAFFQLANQYNQLEYARDAKDIVKRIRAVICKTKGNIGKASKKYDPGLKEMEFYQLVRRYGQEGFREDVIKNNIRCAIDKSGGNLTKASKIYYKSKSHKKAAFQALVKYHHLLTYAETARQRAKGIRSAIQKAKGNLRDAAEIYYGHKNISAYSKRTMFLDLVYRYGQSHFKEYVIRNNIRDAIDKAGGDILKASKIYYGKPNYMNFYYLAKRHGQLKYVRRVKATVNRIHRAIKRSEGRILVASKIFGFSSEESFLRLLKRYGQLGYRKELIKRFVHDAISQANGDIREASEIYYIREHHGHPKSDKPRYVSFYDLSDRYGELAYAKRLKLLHSHPMRIRTHI